MSKLDNKHIIIVILLIVSILFIVGGILIVNNNNNHIDKYAEEQELETSTDYTPVYRDVITDDTASLGYIQQNITEGIDSASILDNANILDTNDTNQSITRFQLATIIYNIIISEDKLSLSTVINISFEDNSDIPLKYFRAVAITSNLGILQYEKRFDGYKYVTKDEVTGAFTRLQEYLDNWTETDDDKESNKNTDADITEDNEQLSNTADSILENRDTKDALNGSSAALYNNPKNLEELTANINNIQAINLNDQGIMGKYDTTDRVYFDYINLDEGMLDYNYMYNLTPEQDPIYFMDNANVIGMTVSDPVHFQVTVNTSGKLVFENFEVLSSMDMYTSGLTKCFGIQDYSIVSAGNIYSDALSPFIVLDKAEVDSIGILVRKDILENIIIDSVDDISNNYIMLVIPLLNTNIPS